MQNNQPTNPSKKLITASSIAGVVIAGALAVGTTLGLPTAGAQAPDATQTTSTVTADAPVQDAEAFAVEDAGIVTVQRVGDTLELVSVDPTEGWTYDEEVEDGEVEVEFTGPNGAELEFAAELQDGEIAVYIEAEGEMSGGYETEDDHEEYEAEEGSEYEDDAEEEDHAEEDDDEHEEDEDHG